MKNKSPKEIALSVVNKLNLPVFLCKENKIPFTKNGFKSATKDPDEVNNFWNRFPKALIGVPTGKISGLFVIDIDEGKNKSGEDNFKNLGFNEPDTIQTFTRNKGRHIIFKFDQTLPQKSTTGTLFGKNIDTRGEGGYVIWAGSKGYIYKEGYGPDDKKISPIPEEIRQHIKKFYSVIPEGQRNNTLFDHSMKLSLKGVSDEKIRRSTLELNRSCESPLGLDEIDRLTNSAISYKLKNQKVDKNISFELTDLGNGKRFAKENKDKALYCIQQKTWYAYEYGKWSNETMLVNRLAEQTTNNINAEISKSPELYHQTKKWAKLSENISRQKAMLCAASHHLDIHLRDFNKNKLLFNMNNTTFDLNKFTNRSQSFKDLITVKSNINYDPQASCNRWLQFLDEITEKDKLQQEYIQKLFGYCLAGQRKEQIIIFITGPGANGKSVLINTISKIFGEYAGIINAKALISSNMGSIPSDKANLYGKRLVTLSEFPEDAPLNTTLLKSITGGDKLSARHLYQGWFEFYPEFVVICAMNKIPDIKEDDIAFYRRLKIIELNRVFSRKEIDKELSKTLDKEASGIFNWCLEGYIKYCKEGLNDTKKIKDSLSVFIKKIIP